MASQMAYRRRQFVSSHFDNWEELELQNKCRGYRKKQGLNGDRKLWLFLFPVISVSFESLVCKVYVYELHPIIHKQMVWQSSSSRLICKSASKNDKDWNKLLPYLLFAYREVPLAFELLYRWQE